jgi:hypothetical protein
MERLDNFSTPQKGRDLDDILSNGYNLDTMASISRGFNILGKDIGSYLGFVVLYLIISLVVGVIPILGTFLGLIISPALQAGFSYYLKGYLKDNNTEFSNFFNGFKSPQIWQLFLAYLVTNIIVVIIAGTAILIISGSTILEYADELASLSDPSKMEANKELIEKIMANGMLAGILIGGLIAGFISILWILTQQFIVFREMGFWEAMEASRKIVAKKYFSYLGWLIVWGIILIVSALPCGLGLVFTIPAFMLSTYALYMQITEDEAVLNA